jgi:SAM-dependent methyltransferase
VFSESAELYDAIYGAFKDYATEAASVATLVRSLRPGAHSILDVGCGTGEHAKVLRVSHGFAVDGLDLDPGMLAVARRKLPDAVFVEADMCSFALGRCYDVVMCLFSSIGYTRTPDRLTAALCRFRDHLAPGGVILVEPWFPPGTLRDGPVPVTRAILGDLRVERAGRVTLDGRLSRLVFHYEIHDAKGARRVEELHELGLFTRDEMMDGFARAALAASYDPEGLTGRGLYVAGPREAPV